MPSWWLTIVDAWSQHLNQNKRRCCCWHDCLVHKPKVPFCSWWGLALYDCSSWPSWLDSHPDTFSGLSCISQQFRRLINPVQHSKKLNQFPILRLVFYQDCTHWVGVLVKACCVVATSWAAVDSLLFVFGDLIKFQIW
jgi:hypothetical protein